MPQAGRDHGRQPEIPVFKPDEVEAFRAAIDRYREPGAYEPGKWMVSGLNRRRDVVGREFPAEVVLRDITPRTTEQMPGVVLPPQERLRLLRAIVECGVPSIQIGVFGRGRTADAIRADVDEVRRINPRCEIVYGGARSIEDVELAAQAGIDSVQFWSAPYVEAAAMFSDVYRRAWRGEDWRGALNLPRDVHDQIRRVTPLVEAGHRNGVRVVGIGINQISFAPDEYVATYSAAMHEAGAPGDHALRRRQRHGARGVCVHGQARVRACARRRGRRAHPQHVRPRGGDRPGVGQGGCERARGVGERLLLGVGPGGSRGDDDGAQRPVRREDRNRPVEADPARASGREDCRL